MLAMLRKSSSRDWLARTLNGWPRTDALETDSKIDPQVVLLTLAIRGKATCELRIPREKYEPFLLMTLIDRHGETVH